MDENQIVDFSNPESIESQLEVEATAAPKEKKPAKPRVIKVTYTADRDIAAGETIEFDYVVPKSTRTMATTIPVEEMTDDQLKIELRNASSVAYKTKKANKDTTNADARVERCRAEMEKRGIKPNARGGAKLDAAAIANLIKSGKISIEELEAQLNMD